MAVDLGCPLAVGLGCGWELACGFAAGLGFRWPVAAGVAGLCLRPALLVEGCGAARVLAVAGALAAGTGFGVWVGGVVRGRGGSEDFGCGAFDEVLAVELDGMVLVELVGESWCEVPVEKLQRIDGEDAKADQMDVGDAHAGFSSGPAIWVLWARRVRVWLPAAGVRAHVSRCPVCVQVLVLQRLVSPGGVPVQHQGHEARCHLQRAELQADRAQKVGSCAVRGGSLCLGRRVTFHIHRWTGFRQQRLVHFARQYSALQIAPLPLRMESIVSRGLCPGFPGCGGCQARPPWCMCRGWGCVGGECRRRGGGSQWRGPSRCQMARGSGWVVDRV